MPQSAMAANVDLWIRRYHLARAGSTQLICFPQAGGSASFYFPVSAALSPAIDVSAVQYPGRQDRYSEPNISSIPRLADAIFAAVRPLADRPLAFFGHSMGAVLAFEVAWRLEQDGLAPLARLYASGRRAPSRYRHEAVHQRSDEEIIAELRKLSGTSTSLLVDPEAVQMILPAIKSDYQAIETYRDDSGRMLNAPIVAMIGDSDPKATQDEARAWAAHTTSTFDLHVFPGGHFYLIDQSARVTQLISADLASLESAP